MCWSVEWFLFSLNKSKHQSPFPAELNMKLLPSPSCSSSSSFSTSTFDAHVCNPRGAATPGCLSGILRRILCSGSLPTHPSDQITEEANSVKSDDDKLLQIKDVGVIKATNQAKPTAGIVARLMGLDPMPEMKLNQNLISRSQSMNSLEHFCKHLEGKHPRVSSTLSFREIPTFLELENEDYFILSFEGESKSKEFRAKERRSERRCEEFKQRKEEEDRCKSRGSNKTERLSAKKTKKKRFDPEEAKEFVLIELKEKRKSRRRISNKPTQKVGNNGRAKISTKEHHGRLQIGGPVAERVANGGKSTRKVESECSSDESSPVSVLDCSQYLRDPEAPLSEDAASSSPIHPRRKLSPELEISQSPSPRNDDDLMIINEGKLPKTKGGGDGAQQAKWEEEICRITETELAESNWKFSKICQEHDDLGGSIAGFDWYIVEGLIEEFVEQMYDLRLKINNM